MKNKRQNRVLAYTLAKEITQEQLTEVSGGSHTSQHVTLHPSFSGGISQMDACVDFSIDW